MKNAEGRTSSRLQNGRRRKVVIDLCVLVATLLSVAVLLGLYYGWPMVGGDLQYDRQIFIAMPAFLVLVVAGLLWVLHCLWPSILGRRTWPWWSAATPAVALSAFLVVVLFPWGRFDEARPQLETIAHEVLAEPEGVRSGVKIRGLDISRVAHHGGAVYFIEADNSFGTTRGWIYSPDGSPDPEGQRYFGSIEHLGGPWYEFERSS
ncbi:DUF1109 domain-containing protein [Rhodococcus oryzae]|uniref:DUF1109 domain-containing protein n=1 Tax=Rhodococcus oryzae TaxID=2571143 RepID=UPI003791A80C